MSTIAVSFTIVFKNEKDAVHFENYWPVQQSWDKPAVPRTDELGLTDQDWPPSEEWSNPNCERKGALVRAHGDNPHTHVQLLLPALKKRTELVMLQANFTQAGDVAWWFIVKGKEVKADQAFARAVALAIDGPLLLSLAIDCADTKALAKVLASGVDPNTQFPWYEKYKIPALWKANRPEVVLALLEAGADPKVKTRNKETLLTKWAWHEGVVRGLLKVGLNPNARGTDSSSFADTALGRACRDAMGTLGAVKALLDAGADANAGKPLPLQEAVEHLQFCENEQRAQVLKVITLLLERGADPRKAKLDSYKDGTKKLKPLLQRFAKA